METLGFLSSMRKTLFSLKKEEVGLSPVPKSKGQSFGVSGLNALGGVHNHLIL